MQSTHQITKEEILKNYYDKCDGSFSISHDNIDGLLQTYIYTPRFTAKKIYSKDTEFQNYSKELQTLYYETFNDSLVMEKFASGVTKDTKYFQDLIQLQSQRYKMRYPFQAFIITENESDTVVGYEVIGGSTTQNFGEIAYLFSKKFQRSEKIKNVGYENIGALTWGYGDYLYNKYDMDENSKNVHRPLVNQIYSKFHDKFIDGQEFKGICATSRTDNIGSYRILTSLGFKIQGTSEKFNSERYELQLDFGKFY